jgi:hypothetical protein
MKALAMQGASCMVFLTRLCQIIHVGRVQNCILNVFLLQSFLTVARVVKLTAAARASFNLITRP